MRLVADANVLLSAEIGGRDRAVLTHSSISEILALALHTGAPIWSNDSDFEDAGLEWFTTAALLAKLQSEP